MIIHRGVSRTFHQGQIPFFGEGQKYFYQGKNWKGKNCPPPPLKKFCSRGHNTQDGGRISYLANERLVFSSAPYSPMRAFSIRGRNVCTILNFIWGIFPPDLIHQGHMPLIYPRLYSPLVIQYTHKPFFSN